MALKPDRLILEYEIGMTCDTATERGVVLVLGTSGSGVAVGDSANAATLASNASGKIPVGMLLNDVVDIDTTRYHINFHKDETLINNRCAMGRKGYVVTNKISGTPAVGDTAYLTSNGQLTPTVSSTGGTAATPKFGKFESIKDENGYVKVSFNLPIV
jgi:hypothetical protein